MKVMKVTRADIEDAIARYGHFPSCRWPSRFQNPRDERSFCIAIALGVPEATPVYDSSDELMGFRGIALKENS